MNKRRSQLSNAALILGHWNKLTNILNLSQLIGWWADGHILHDMEELNLGPSHTYSSCGRGGGGFKAREPSDFKQLGHTVSKFPLFASVQRSMQCPWWVVNCLISKNWIHSLQCRDIIKVEFEVKSQISCSKSQGEIMKHAKWDLCLPNHRLYHVLHFAKL